MIEERAFLQAILEQPNDDGRKLVYADWLEEQGDPRGEYLRLMIQMRQGRVVTPEQRQLHQELSAELAELRARERQAWLDRQGSSPENRERQRRVQELEGRLSDLSRQIRQQVPARLQELAATLDPNWLVVVGDTEIESCGKSGGDGWRLRFDVVCDRTWADLKPTGDTAIRDCESCRKSVHFCDNLADAREHAQAGHCIAVDLGVIRREKDLERRAMFLGQPSAAAIRQELEEDIDPVSQARLESRKKTGGKRRARRR
jgi:uncharacterized protein (TIGR02996 family)